MPLPHKRVPKNGQPQLGIDNSEPETRNPELPNPCSVRPCINPLHIIDERLAHHAVATRCRVVTGEIPVAAMVRTGAVQVFDLLEIISLCLATFGPDDLGDLFTDLLGGEGLIDHAHESSSSRSRLIPVAPCSAWAGLVDDVLEVMFFQQGDGGTESDQVADARHVDAVTVGIPDLWRRTDDHDLLRTQPVEHADDGILQRGSAHDRVVDHNQVVDTAPHAAVRDVVHVRHHIATVRVVGDEGPQLRVLQGDLLPRAVAWRGSR